MMKTLCLKLLHYDILRSRLLILLFILLPIASKKSSGAHYQYESCSVARKCSNGPNISFPFFITGLQESYCGYPGFGLNCSQDGFPALQLPENEYIVENIFYNNRSLQVYDAAVSGINISYDNGTLVIGGSYPGEDSSCVPIIRNTTLPTPQFHFASGITSLHFVQNCTGSLPPEIGAYSVACSTVSSAPRPLAIFGTSADLRTALEYCTSNVVAPVNGYYNALEALRRGFVLNWNASDSCSPCQLSGGRCGSDATTNNFRCLCPDRPRLDRCYPIPRKSKTKLRLIEGLAAALAIVSVLVTCIFIVIRKYRSNGETQNQKDIEVFLKNHENLAPKRYTYKKLKKITNSFHDKLGKGGYGSVYRGKLEDRRLVAVKILDESKGNGEEFMNEVASISRTSHVNIVSLLGFCFDGSKRALIYEFMPNGSLEKFILNTTSSTEGQIGWEKLFEIAVGIAIGLDYLHQGCNTRILHLDIKPQNILLDEDMKPKIADFGLAKLCPNRASIVSMVVARGTIGYIAPEVFCRNFGDVSHKSDVYSYGMMVLDMVGKRNDVDPGVDGSTASYFPRNIYKDLEIDVENGALEENKSENECESVKRKLTVVGLWCIQTDPKDRPSMTGVLEMLEGKLESLQVPPKPQSSSNEAFASSISTSESVYSN